MKHEHKDKYTQMTTEPVHKLIGSLAVPTIISMLVTSLYVMIDTYFVGKINTQATAAVGISFSVMAIIQAFGSSDTGRATLFRAAWEHEIIKVPKKWLQPASLVLSSPDASLRHSD